MFISFLFAYIFLSHSYLLLAQKTVSVDGGSVYGECSAKPTNNISYSAISASSGFTAAYVLPETQYRNLLQNFNSTSRKARTRFTYYPQLSCYSNSAPITNCTKDTQDFNVNSTEKLCLALVNQNAETVSIELSLAWDATSESGGISPALVILLSMSGLGILLIIVAITGYRKYQQHQLSKQKVEVKYSNDAGNEPAITPRPLSPAPSVPPAPPIASIPTAAPLYNPPPPTTAPIESASQAAPPLPVQAVETMHPPGEEIPPQFAPPPNQQYPMFPMAYPPSTISTAAAPEGYFPGHPQFIYPPPPVTHLGVSFPRQPPFILPPQSNQQAFYPYPAGAGFPYPGDQSHQYPPPPPPPPPHSTTASQPPLPPHSENNKHNNQ